MATNWDDASLKLPILIKNNVHCFILKSLHCGVGGVKVSIVAFQAIDPGSIPG